MLLVSGFLSTYSGTRCVNTNQASGRQLSGHPKADHLRKNASQEEVSLFLLQKVGRVQR